MVLVVTIQCGQFRQNGTLSRNVKTKDFARLTSHPVRCWTGKNKAFCSPGTQNGRRGIKVYRAALSLLRTVIMASGSLKPPELDLLEDFCCRNWC